MQDWDNYTDANDENFPKTFGEVIYDAKISEAVEDFTPDTFNDTYLNKEIALASGVHKVQFVKGHQDTATCRWPSDWDCQR